MKAALRRSPATVVIDSCSAESVPNPSALPSVATTEAPSPANRSAVARPIPEAAPVTITRAPRWRPGSIRSAVPLEAQAADTDLAAVLLELLPGGQPILGDPLVPHLHRHPQLLASEV